ncbi:MAG: hypothetical protein ABI770_02490 [Sphingomicrobium sp.]
MYDLLLKRRIPKGHDWAGLSDTVKRAFRWPLEGLLFGVEEAGLWWPEWGERPSEEADRGAVVAEVVAKAPKLIPLMGHRYLPARPHQVGNPVFSVYQSDIIVYGANLQDWMLVEFGPRSDRKPGQIPHTIDFWSLAVSRHGDAKFYPFAEG